MKNNFRRIILVLICATNVLILATSAYSDPTSLTCNTKFNKNNISIVVKTKEFIKNEHKIQEISEYSYLVDGRRPIGTPVLPGNEISEFTIKWNGKKVKFPKELYADCYDLSLWGLTTIVSRSGKMVMVKMRGSDGAYAYTVYWMIDKKNVFDRFVIENEDQFDDIAEKTKCKYE